MKYSFSSFSIISIKNLFLTILLNLITIISTNAATGKWKSLTVGSNITFKITESTNPTKDYNGNYVTVVYLKNLSLKKIGRISNKKNIQWLLSQGYRVIELDYKKNKNAIGLKINEDIISINDSIAAANFCGLKNCSLNKSYILFEGYRIARDITYFIDNPKIYNSPEQYTIGDPLHMDIIYPYNPKNKIPTILSFSYSNSYAFFDNKKGMLTDAYKDQRLFLPYSFAGFNDSFLEGAAAQGMAWAIADHPKYCQWGKGKTPNGPNDSFKSFETNPDTAQKVKSAIRTLRVFAEENGLSDKIGIFGFSRGSTAGSMAIGDKKIEEIEKAGFHIGVADDVQAAALGPGVFDYTLIYNTIDDGDKNLEQRCPWVWGALEHNRNLWNSMGSSYLVEKTAAPTLFFYNTDDDPYYGDQINNFKIKLDALEVPTDTLINYGKGHAVPQTETTLNSLYSFFKNYLFTPKLNK
ncbi:alpha/beta hydrolase family protein [Flavobacterium flavipallidum]|uniref:Alpha/beta hydrolase family protein n=1 Tax=Flavobacterium flavipallidum TaxID=3139140 RepID=A0ABU9HNA1_9FLAO